MKWIVANINKLVNSFDTKNDGFSGRKLSAFVGIIACVVLSYKYTSSDNLEGVLTIWLVFVAVCLGLVTAEQIMNLKNGNQQPNAD